MVIFQTKCVEIHVNLPIAAMESSFWASSRCEILVLDSCGGCGVDITPPPPVPIVAPGIKLLGFIVDMDEFQKFIKL